MAFAIPLIGLIGTGVSAAGSVIQGMQQSNALKSNAEIYAQEGKTAAAQGYEAEATQRRAGAMAIGREVAAAGQSGGGYQGSTGASIRQSAVNAEHDALSIRYRAQLQKWAYDTQSQNLRDDARTVANTSFLKAGAQLLKGYADYKAAGTMPDLGGGQQP